jgi:GNAT superfamily N-acetyltransferase/RimJ/RimL family protein N-acetyltransferase
MNKEKGTNGPDDIVTPPSSFLAAKGARMQSQLVIDDLALPTTLDGQDADDFLAAVEVYNVITRHALGAAADRVTPAEMLASVQDQAYMPKRLFVARRDDTVVAMAFLAWSVEPNTRVTWIDVRVRPEWRNQGIGISLFDHLESIARESGRPFVQGQAVHEVVPGGPRLESPTGFGSLPRDEATVRFLLGRGYNLEQVNRMSILHLPVMATTLAEHLATAQERAGKDYRVVTWAGDTPERWLDDVALIMNRMSTDAPSGNLEIEEETWDAERVRHHDEQRRQSGRVRLVAAVEHVPGGRLVAFNGLSVPGERTRPVQQGVTLVLREHRGHRLGMITKIANIQQLQAFSPESPSIITDNAEENRPMLDVNEAVGFVPLAYLGAWKKTVT